MSEQDAASSAVMGAIEEKDLRHYLVSCPRLQLGRSMCVKRQKLGSWSKEILITSFDDLRPKCRLQRAFFGENDFSSPARQACASIKGGRGDKLQPVLTLASADTT